MWELLKVTTWKHQYPYLFVNSSSSTVIYLARKFSPIDHLDYYKYGWNILHFTVYIKYELIERRNLIHFFLQLPRCSGFQRLDKFRTYYKITPNPPFITETWNGLYFKTNIDTQSHSFSICLNNLIQRW